MSCVLEMANRVSNDQLEELLGFLADHPTIAKGVGLGARSKEAIDKQWNDLAIRLNSYGSGSSKSGERWKKVRSLLLYFSKDARSFYCNFLFKLLTSFLPNTFF